MTSYIELVNAPITHAFEAGNTYYLRFIGDSNLIVKFTITRRTASSVWAVEEGQTEPKRFKIKTWDGAEFFRPYGNYSMSPGLYASRPASEL